MWLGFQIRFRSETTHLHLANGIGSGNPATSQVLTEKNCKESTMPQIELQSLIFAFTSEGTLRPVRRAKCTAYADETPASSVRGICAEEHVFNWQSLWIDLGGEG